MKIALYARVSSEKQDVDLSITAQLKALRKHVIDNGHQVVAEFVDEVLTGRTTNRPAFRKMISLAKSPDKPFEQILIWKYARFARNRYDSIVYKAMLKKAGVTVVSFNEPFDDTPTGRLMEAIIEIMDEVYSDNLGEEVTRGMRESASRGFYLSSRPPYGYRKVRVIDGAKERTRLELEPGQAGIVASAFNDMASGKGLTEVVRKLNRKGILTSRGKSWGKTSLYNILTNEIYTGVYVWGRNSKRGLDPIRTENACPQIVDRETFIKVQKLMRSRAPKIQHPKRASSPFLLSGLATCGYCGKALVGKYAKSSQFSYYVCGTLDKKGRGSCQARYLNTGKFEALVVNKIKEKVLTRDNLAKLVTMVNEEIDSAMVSFQDEIGLISESISDVGLRLERLYDAMETGKPELNDLIPRIRELRERQDQLQASKYEIEAQMSDRKVELADLETVSDYVDDLYSLLQEGSLTERRAFIKSFIIEAKVTGNEVVLTYTTPVLPDTLNVEKDIVLPTVQSGGPFWTRTRDPSLIRTVL